MQKKKFLVRASLFIDVESILKVARMPKCADADEGISDLAQVISGKSTFVMITIMTGRIYIAEKKGKS